MSAPAPTRPRVLLADDHVQFLEFACNLLAPAFEVVGTAGDGNRALELARRLRPDVVVLDVAMPGLNGFEALEQLTRETPQPAIVFLTMQRDDEFVAAAINGGAHGYVLKTQVSQHLAGTITHALAGRLVFPSLTSLAAAAGGRHTVQFHTWGDQYLDDVSRLVGAVLRSGEPVVMVTSEEIRRGVAQRLMAGRVNLEQLARQGLYAAHDSDAALSHVMVDGRPDRQRVAEFVAGLDQASIGPDGARRRVMLFGDMAVALCEDGQFAAAIELERLWNELTRASSILTVCSYPVAAFEHGDHALHEVCAEHSAVTGVLP